MIRSILETAGHEAVVVCDGEEAIDALESGPYDLAIVDMHMPKMNGLDVIRVAKWTLPEGQTTPFIVLTADATQSALDECKEAGASAFITKPVEPHRLLSGINALMVGRQQTAPKQKSDAVSLAAVRPKDELSFDRGTLDSLRSLGQPETLIASVVDVFEADAERLLKQIRAALTTANFGDCRKSMHSLKGGAASIGAKKLHALCASIEQLDDGQLAERSSTILRDLGESHRSICIALQSYLHRDVEPTPFPSRPAVYMGDDGKVKPQRRRE